MKCCETMIIPFMKNTNSTEVIFDCTNVYHNKDVYELFESEGIDVYPSSGYGHNVKGGYPPNSHETMPNEQMHNDLKQDVYKKFNAVRSSRRKMTALHRIVKECAAEFPVAKARAKIDNLPSIFEAILARNGKRTYY